MSLSDRDRKIVLLLVPLALIAAYWLLLFSPKREEAASATTKLELAQSDQQTAESQAASLSGAKKGFSDDYTTVIRLGKAVPSAVDMPSLLLQLDRAARGTQISWDKITVGERTTPAAATTQAPAGGSTGNAQSGTGKVAQNAKAGVANANATNQGNANAANGTSTPAGGSSGAAGLESVPLDFTYTGTFFDLADFFHRMKRFVRVVNSDIVVRGRLITIDAFKFTAGNSFPNLSAEIHATVYLAPKAEGVTAGATPAGPSGTATPSTPSTPAASGSAPSPPSTTAPAATVK